MARLSRDAMRVLIGEIVSGSLAPGDKLRKESDLTERFSASRGTIRESVRALEERGLVRVIHGVGAVVEPGVRWNILDADVLGAMLATDRRPVLLADFLESRRILEVEAVALAAERASREELERIRLAFERLEDAARAAAINPLDELNYLKADAEFHSAILDAAGNAVLGRMVEPLRQALQTIMRPLARPEHRIHRSLPEHRRIMNAILSRNVAESRAAMESHLATSQEYLSSIRVDATQPNDHEPSP